MRSFVLVAAAVVGLCGSPGTAAAALARHEPARLAAADAAAAAPPRGKLPRIVVRADNVRVTRSCVLVVPRGAVVEDADGNGVIHVEADDIEISFDEEHGTLRGIAEPVAWDDVSGTGIRIEGHHNVTIRGARVHGYKVGIHADRADGLALESCDVSGGFAMRLHSTPEAEDTSDWLDPQVNDGEQWVQRYGAGIAVKASRGVTVRGCVARRRQNGLILDRVTESRVFDNDFSFLSGWGIALWRSSGNLLSRNAVDFCIRGYSHGVYNRGQDSAGILFFEQCSDNVVAENSATHCGDGFFGFGGAASLERSARTGNNGNLLLRNDFSDAAAHGIEMTFSFDNRFLGNRIADNAICGVWGGYSQNTLIARNRIERNGDQGYGLERGGIDIEHGADNAVRENVFIANACGVHLWDDDDGDLLRKPWCVANHRGSRGNEIRRNRFERDRVGIHLRATAEATRVSGNDMVEEGEPLRLEGGAEVDEGEDPLPALAVEEPVLLGKTRPVGARRALGGRESIRMGAWFPWDHASPWIGLLHSGPGEYLYEVRGLPAAAVRVTGRGVVATREQVAPPGAGGGRGGGRGGDGAKGARAVEAGEDTAGRGKEKEAVSRWLLRVRAAAGGPVEWRLEVDPRQARMAPITDRLRGGG